MDQNNLPLLWDRMVLISANSMIYHKRDQLPTCPQSAGLGRNPTGRARPDVSRISCANTLTRLAWTTLTRSHMPVVIRAWFKMSKISWRAQGFAKTILGKRNTSNYMIFRLKLTTDERRFVARTTAFQVETLLVLTAPRASSNSHHRINHLRQHW